MTRIFQHVTAGVEYPECFSVDEISPGKFKINNYDSSSKDGTSNRINIVVEEDLLKGLYKALKERFKNC